MTYNLLYIKAKQHLIILKIKINILKMFLKNLITVIDIYYIK